MMDGKSSLHPERKERYPIYKNEITQGFFFISKKRKVD
jgi:hypothetical protein